MERIICRKTLDVHKGGIQFTLQGFTTSDNLSRRLEISFMASGDTVDFPLENTVAMIYVTTPSAQEPSIEKCEIKDNKIIYNMLPIIEEGITEMQIKVIGTSVSGTKSVLGAPKFAIEVEKSNTDDEGAEQKPSFTALEDAVAKAMAVYDSRLLRIEFDEVCVFRAYYADGTVYETDAIRRLLLQESTNLNLNTLVEEGIANITADEVADVLADKLDERYRELFGKAMYVSDILADFPEAMFVSWDAKTENTPYKAGLTDITEGFALACGKKSGRHTVSAWTKGGTGTNCFVYADGTWKSLLSSLADEGLAKADLGNVEDEVFLKKMKDTEMLGTIKIGENYYDCEAGEQYYAPEGTVRGSIFLSSDCLGIISTEKQEFFDRQTGELFSSFEVDIYDSYDKSKSLYLQQHPELPDICVVQQNGGTGNIYLFNYRTGVHTHFGWDENSYDGYYEPYRCVGISGDSIFIGYRNARSGLRVKELDRNTLQQLNQRDVSSQTSDDIYLKDWLGRLGYKYRLYTIADAPKELRIEQINLSNGNYNAKTIYTDTNDIHQQIYNVTTLFIDEANSEIYFYFNFKWYDTGIQYGDGVFAKYNYSTDTFTTIKEETVDSISYICHINNNTAIMKYNSYLSIVNTFDFKVERVCPISGLTLFNSSGMTLGQIGGGLKGYKYILKGGYLPCYITDSQVSLLDLNTFELIGLKKTETSYYSCVIPYSGKDFVCGSSYQYIYKFDETSSGLSYRTFGNGFTLPETTTIKKIVRRDI